MTYLAVEAVMNSMLATRLDSVTLFVFDSPFLFGRRPEAFVAAFATDAADRSGIRMGVSGRAALRQTTEGSPFHVQAK